VTNQAGRTLMLRETVGDIIRLGRFTVLGMEDALMRPGVLGGHVTSGPRQGRAAAGLLQRYLQGEPLTALPPIEASPNEYLFDQTLLQSLGFVLPPDIARQAAFVNPVASFYASHRSAILGTLFGLAGLLLLTFAIILVFDLRRRRELATSAQRLAESEAYLRTILDAEPECVKIIGADGALLQMNAAGLAMIEAQDNPAQVLGQKVTGLLLPAHRRAFVELTQRVLAGESGALAFEIVGLKGTRRWLETHAVPLKNPTTGEVTLLGVTRDITRHRQAEQRLRASEERLRVTLEVSPNVAVQWYDRDGRVLYWNAASEKLYGWRADEALGKTPDQLIHTPEETAAFVAVLAKMAASGEPVGPAEYATRHRTGDLRWVDATIFPIPGDAPEAPIFVCMDVDISARKALESVLFEHQAHLEEMVAERTADLEAARAEAERLAAVKSEFLANMSHEIRTPLNAVLGLARIGARDSAGHAAHATFARIRDAGQHLLGVINDILDFSRLDAGKLSIESHPFALAAALANAASFITGAATQKGLSYAVTASPELPAWVRGDAQRLQQILVNLLSNAVKFTEHGEVRLRVAPDGENIYFKVIDSGVGMSAEQIERLFRPFEQADSSTTRKYGGSGLGLAISRNLALLMGGEITVDSAPGAGSSFTLRLPLPAAQAEVPVLAAANPGRRRLAGLHLLAAEDVEVNRLVLEDLLLHEGAHVLFAENGLQAIEQLEATGVSAFDAVLMDVQMPVMDGLEATRRIHALAPALPVIGLTAHALGDEREKCLAAGMVEHVTKPIDVDALVAAILRHADAAEGEVSAAHPGSAGQGGFDEVALLARYDGREAFVARLATTVLTSHRDTPERLRAAAAAHDLAALGFTAHGLKSMAGNLLASGVQDRARRLEFAARRGDAEAAIALADGLAQATDALLAALGARFER
jgi:PAS domain S-box-containing protein